MPISLDLNIESLSPRKICVVSQLATRYSTLVILLQEIHCTNAEQLLISHFALAGLVSSKKYGLAAFVYEKLSWALTDRSPNQQLSGCVWASMVARSLTSTNLQTPNYYQKPFQCSHTPGNFNCQYTHRSYDFVSLDG